MLPRSAKRHAALMLREKRDVLLSVRRSWRQMGSEFDASWETLVGPQVLRAVVGGQDAVAEAAAGYVPDVLAETGQRVTDRAYELRAQAWAGTAGDGRSVQTLTHGAVTRAKTAVGQGATQYQALMAGGVWLSQAVGTVMADTARSAERVEMGARHVGGYVRMLNPPSCGRCVILAGRRYQSSTAFQRHPNCDCTHIPAAESISGDLLVNPEGYLDHLDDDELARTLGSRANARAYRDGADTNQLVNAYRRSGDVRPAQVYGRRVKFTTEGTTRRGFAHGRMSQAGSFSGSLRSPRLMPESIFSLAENRADSLRLLKLYGWVF